MPHAIIEFSENITSLMANAAVSRLVHNEMIASGLFTPADIKTRAYATSDFLVGELGVKGSFVHITVRLLEGRTTEQKQCLSEAIREALRLPLASVNQVSIEVHDMTREPYRKLVTA